MVIECPNCKFFGNAPDDKIPETGITVTCPKCKTKFGVKKPTVLLPQNATPSPETKACRFCGEQILVVAIKCKHCGGMPEEDQGKGVITEDKKSVIAPSEDAHKKGHLPNSFVFTMLAFVIFVFIPVMANISSKSSWMLFIAIAVLQIVVYIFRKKPSVPTPADKIARTEQALNVDKKIEGVKQVSKINKLTTTHNKFNLNLFHIITIIIAVCGSVTCFQRSLSLGFAILLSFIVPTLLHASDRISIWKGIALAFAIYIASGIILGGVLGL